MGKFWRWHINFCPGWKAYFKSLPANEQEALRKKYQFTKYWTDEGRKEISLPHCSSDMGASGYPDNHQGHEGIQHCTILTNRGMADTHGVGYRYVSSDIPKDGKAILRTDSRFARKECAMADLPDTRLVHHSLHDGARHRPQADAACPYPVHRFLLFGIRADANRICFPILARM